jgi:hypothetical protein
MTPDELDRAVEELFPGNGKGAFADAVGIDPSTAWRFHERGRVPGPVAAVVSAWLVLSRKHGLVPPPKPFGPADLDELVEVAAPGMRKKSGLSGVEAAAFVVFGEGWKTKMRLGLGVDASTLWRQLAAGNPSGPLMAAVRAWLVIWRLEGGLPEACLPREIPRLKRKKKAPTYARLLLED